LFLFIVVYRAGTGKAIVVSPDVRLRTQEAQAALDNLLLSSNARIKKAM
jgi:hypothetical protein